MLACRGTQPVLGNYGFMWFMVIAKIRSQATNRSGTVTQ
jgi:hypothetical protein